MTTRELAEEILQRIKDGTLDPEAVVVRPFCACEDDNGYLEADHLDQVVRRYDEVSEPEWFKDLDGKFHSRVYKYGSVEPGPLTCLTLKLG